MLASQALHCPCPVLLCQCGTSDCTNMPGLHTTSEFQLTEVAIPDLPVLRKQQQVPTSTATVNSERTMQGCPWYGPPMPHRSTGIYWWLLSKLKSSPPTYSDSPFLVKWGTDIYLLNSTHANTFSWTCIQLCSTHIHQIYLGKTALLGEESRKFIIWLFPYPWSPLHWSFSLLYPASVFHVLPEIE